MCRASPRGRTESSEPLPILRPDLVLGLSRYPAYRRYPLFGHYSRVVRRHDVSCSSAVSHARVFAGGFPSPRCRFRACFSPKAREQLDGPQPSPAGRWRRAYSKGGGGSHNPDSARHHPIPLDRPLVTLMRRPRPGGCCGAASPRPPARRPRAAPCCRPRRCRWPQGDRTPSAS
jgi:hypothetical protein